MSAALRRRRFVPKPSPALAAFLAALRPVVFSGSAVDFALSCQDGRQERVARLLDPPRGLRADEAEEQTPGTLAQPDPRGAQLLQRRQAAGLQCQRLAEKERQTGACKPLLLLFSGSALTD